MMVVKWQKMTRFLIENFEFPDNVKSVSFLLSHPNV